MSKVELDDFLIENPFHLLVNIRREDSDFQNVRMDYFHYLTYLKIIWRRIKEESDEVMDYESLLFKMESLGQANSDANFQIGMNSFRVKYVLQCDIETFVVFARIFMDKVGKLVVKLIKLPPGLHISESFTDHKKDFLKRTDLNPAYSLFLKNETNWYEQDLLVWRDKILMHGTTLSTGLFVSQTRGIRLIKHFGVFQIRESDRSKLNDIIAKYQQKYPVLEITNNPSMMIEDFREQISKHDIRMEKKDLDDFGFILSRAGATLDIREIARNIKHFTEKVASIFSS